MKQTTKFSDKNILVVGGNGGIGLSLVRRLREADANVLVISRSPANEFNQGRQYLQLDVTGDLSSLSDFLPNQLHGLVYSVGSINLKPFSRLSEDCFLRDYQLNVLGAVKVLQRSLTRLKNSEGAAVVLISSVAAKVGLPYHASISAAKSAVEGLAISLASELAGVNVRVNVVSPSLTDTALASQLLNSPEKRAASAKRHPLGRFGQPGDISDAIVFLLSDQSSWITGQVISVDGGLGNLSLG